MKRKTPRSNGIVRETLHATALKALGCAASIEVVQLKRNANGDWSYEARVEISTTLSDGRILAVTRRINIGRIVQEGRKPRRNPTCRQVSTHK